MSVGGCEVCLATELRGEADSASVEKGLWFPGDCARRGLFPPAVEGGDG